MSTFSAPDSSGTSSLVDEGWVNWFCSLNGNHIFCEVDKQFMEDSFNLFGLKQYIAKDFTKVMNTVLDQIDPDDTETEDLSKPAAFLYGLIHARYILSTNGLSAMRKKYLMREFGECPRAYCNGQAVLPVGRSDDPRMGSYSLFCPKCRDLYNCHPSQRHIDGAFFGTTFPHVFMMTFEDLVPSPPSSSYVPRLFGFKIHPSSSSVPQPINYYVGSSSSSSTSSPPPAAAAAASSTLMLQQYQQDKRLHEHAVTTGTAEVEGSDAAPVTSTAASPIVAPPTATTTATTATAATSAAVEPVSVSTTAADSRGIKKRTTAEAITNPESQGVTSKDNVRRNGVDAVAVVVDTIGNGGSKESTLEKNTALEVSAATATTTAVAAVTAGGNSPTKNGDHSELPNQAVESTTSVPVSKRARKS